MGDDDRRSELSFTYDQLKSWYDTLRVRTLDPALTTATRYLHEMLEANLSEFDRLRMTLRPGRIKSTARLWDKIHQPRYEGSISSLDDITNYVDDLVGLRIVCNNTSDIDALQTMLSTLPEHDDEPDSAISIESTKERIYHKEPKASGYRAYHVNLSVRVGSGIHGWTSVSVELQVRTLLQDGWGELTHEDTYKPGTELPPLVATLARRMANLLSCVDELAQDLRDELDHQAPLRLTADTGPSEVLNDQKASGDSKQQELADVRWSSSEDCPPADPQFPEEALLEETRTLVAGLDRPTPLAHIAIELQSLFGNHISRQHWGRFGSFKSLLLHAVPDVRIESVGPSWIIPPGFEPNDIPGYSESQQEIGAHGIPAVVQKLRQFEPSIPSVSSEELGRYLNAAAAALDPGLWQNIGISKSNLGIRDINLLSKEIRDKVNSGGQPLGRSRLSYVLLSLLNSGNLRPGLGTEGLRQVFGSFIYARIRHHGICIDDDDEAELAVWLGRERPEDS